MKSFISRMLAKAIVCVVFLASTTSAFALDGKRYPGTLCQSTSTNLVYGMTAYNKSTTSSLTVYCPLMRDYQYEDLTLVKVGVYDRSTSGAVSCTLDVIQGNGIKYYTKTLSTSTTGSSDGVQSISFTDDVVSPDGAFYALTCTIPATNNGQNSGILYYYVEEGY